MHLSDEQIDRLLHSEFAAAERQIARVHLDTCGDCGQRALGLAAEDEEIGTALSLLDRPVPRRDVAGLIRRRGRARDIRRMVVIGGAFVAASAAAAMPGSPLRRWLAQPFSSNDAPAAWTELTPAHTSTGSPHGVAIALPDSLTIQFTRWQNRGVLILHLNAIDTLVRVETADSTASFAVGPNGVRVENDGSSAAHRAFIPSTVRHVHVLVDGTVVYRRSEGQVLVGPADAANPMTISLVQPDKR